MADENKTQRSINNINRDMVRGLGDEENPKNLSDNIPDFDDRLKKIRRKSNHGNSNGDILSLASKVSGKDRNVRKSNTGDDKKDFIKDFIEENIENQDFSSEIARVSRYDDYRIIDKFIPEISTSIDVFATSIIAPDDTSKLSLMYRYGDINNKNESENKEVLNELDRIVKKYNLDNLTYTSIRDGLLLGDVFYIIKDTKSDFEEILNENDDVLGRETRDDQKVINESFIDQNLKESDLDTVINEFNNQFEKPIKDEDQLNEQRANFKNEILKSINENVAFFENSSELLSDIGKYKGSNDLQAFLDKADNKNKSSKLKSGSVYFRSVEPEDMIKLEIDGMCIGYLYIEPDSGTDLRGGANPLLSAMNNLMGDGYQKQGQTGSFSSGMGVTNLDPVTGGTAGNNMSSNSKNPNSGMNATSGSYYENGNTVMAYQGLVDVIVKGISQKINMDFINKNDSFKDIIYRLIRKNYIIENGIKMTFLEADEVFHHKLDSQKTYGVSKLNKSLFFAKLYLSTLITTMMVKLNQSRDRRVFRVNAGLDDDYEGTVEEIIRNVRQNEMSTGLFGDGTSVQTLFNQVGNLENMYIPQNKEGTSPLEIDTISGIQVDINDEFLEWLKKSVISGTGVPLNYIDAETETDYARSLSMQNNNFVRRVVNYQKSFGEFYTGVLRKLYYLENVSKNKKENEELNNRIQEIEAYFPAPVFLNLGNLNEEVGAVTQMIDFLVPLYTSEASGDEEEDDNEKLKRLFRKELVQQEFMANLDYDRYEDIINNIKDEINKDKKKNDMVNNNNTDEDDLSSSDDSGNNSEDNFEDDF
ncbi:portal vertex protein [Staphylococcus phage Madawaska]|nr:portal vertex protein [Staphylococcus phage Madawaska]